MQQQILGQKVGSEKEPGIISAKSERVEAGFWGSGGVSHYFCGHCGGKTISIAEPDEPCTRCGKVPDFAKYS